MGTVWAIFKPEFRSFFTTSMGYVILVVFLFLAGFLTIKGRFFEMRQADLRVFFDNLPLLYIFFIPAAGMRLWAEERKAGTIEFLFTQPVTVTQAVLGKFAAAWMFLVVALALTVPLVITVSWLGSPDPFVILTGYLGALLMGGRLPGREHLLLGPHPEPDRELRALHRDDRPAGLHGLAGRPDLAQRHLAPLHDRGHGQHELHRALRVHAAGRSRVP